MIDLKIRQRYSTVIAEGLADLKDLREEQLDTFEDANDYLDYGYFDYDYADETPMLAGAEEETDEYRLTVEDDYDNESIRLLLDISI